MNLDHIRNIVKRKPIFFVGLTLLYLLIVLFLKWQWHVSWDMLFFVLGGLLGIYFLDIAEVFFALDPSPFRGMVFVGAFVMVALFVATSADSALASGLVLSTYMTLFLWQLGQWRAQHDLSSWYRMLAFPVSVSVQSRGLWIFGVLFLVTTILFIR